MKRYEFAIEELVQVWVKQTVRVEAESKEEIMEHIRLGNFFEYYDVEFDRYETMDDTMDHLEFDYDLVEPEDMEEIEG